jgi:hypothetical protein
MTEERILDRLIAHLRAHVAAEPRPAGCWSTSRREVISLG